VSRVQKLRALDNLDSLNNSSTAQEKNEQSRRWEKEQRTGGSATDEEHYSGLVLRTPLPAAKSFMP
jgi:hypothetical protein